MCPTHHKFQTIQMFRFGFGNNKFAAYEFRDGASLSIESIRK